MTSGQHADYCDSNHKSGKYLCSEERESRLLSKDSVSNKYLAIEIGCLECDVESNIIGVFGDLKDAKKAAKERDAKNEEVDVDKEGHSISKVFVITNLLK